VKDADDDDGGGGCGGRGRGKKRREMEEDKTPKDENSLEVAVVAWRPDVDDKKKKWTNKGKRRRRERRKRRLNYTIYRRIFIHGHLLVDLWPSLPIDEFLNSLINFIGDHVKMIYVCQ